MANMSLSVKDAIWFLSGQLSEDSPVRNVRIDSTPFTVGRRSDSSLTLPIPSVSSRHAEFTLRNGALYVRDQNSTNGTYVNGHRIDREVGVTHGDLVQFAQVVFRAGIEKTECNTNTIQDDASDRALALIQFDKLMTDRAVDPHFQPIVEMQQVQTVAYEILGRSRLFGLSTPDAMFSTAAALNVEDELSRILRVEGVRNAAKLPGDPLLFVNTHPVELTDVDVMTFSLHELREIAPERKLVLEIHEAAVTRLATMRELRAVLNDLDIGLAYDDFGAGQARLLELVEIPPDYLKFDLALVRNIHTATSERQQMLESLTKMVCDLGIAALAEGVETEEGHEICKQMGFDYAQGFYYGRPALPKAYAEGKNLPSS